MGPKKGEITRAQTPPLAQVMNVHASKTLHTGPIALGQSEGATERQEGKCGDITGWVGGGGGGEQNQKVRFGPGVF